MIKDKVQKFYWVLLGIIMVVCSINTVQASSGETEDLKKQITELSDRIDKLEENGASEKDFTVFWKEGLNLATEDGSFKLKMGGRLMNDWFWSSEDDKAKTNFGEQEDGVEFRRARLYFSGSIYENVKYKLQFDFEGGDADFKDAWIAFTDFPLGTVKIGHFKEPFSLEELTSSKYITFLERALPNTFSPSRNSGIMLHRVFSDEKMTAALGLFRDTDNYGEDSGDDGGYNITGRITALPIYENKGEKLLHVGAAYSYRNPDDSYSFDASPEAHLANDFVDTGTIAGDRMSLLGLETAWVDGPLSVQGEYMRADAGRFTGSDLSFDGYYVQASYFLTGEHRSYKTSEAAFSRTKPKKNFKYGVAPGAWEVKARYSELDLNDSNVMGGQLDDITFGLNWYLNPNTKIMWDYINSDTDNQGSADMFMMRLQYDF